MREFMNEMDISLNFWNTLKWQPKFLESVFKENHTVATLVLRSNAQSSWGSFKVIIVVPAIHQISAPNLD